MWSAKQLQLQGDPTLLRPPPSAFGAPLAPTWELLQVGTSIMLKLVIVVLHIIGVSVESVCHYRDLNPRPLVS
jgi:hypothetical protein